DKSFKIGLSNPFGPQPLLEESFVVSDVEAASAAITKDIRDAFGDRPVTHHDMILLDFAGQHEAVERFPLGIKTLAAELIVTWPILEPEEIGEQHFFVGVK